MKMATYQQAKAMVQMDLADCFRNATNDDHIQLMNMAVDLDKPVLIGLSNVNTIIKPFKPGDDVHSYESLYDTSLNVADLHRMRSHNVKDPDHIPPSIFHVEFKIPIALMLKVNCQIKARDHGELRSRISHLEKNDVSFNTELIKSVLRAFHKEVTETDGEINFSVGAATEVELDNLDPPEWKFVGPL